MKLLEKFALVATLPGVSISIAAGVQDYAVAGALNLGNQTLTPNWRATIRRLYDMRFTPGTAGVLSLESGSLILTGLAVQPLRRALSPSSLTALLDYNVLGLASEWILPGAAIQQSVPGFAALANIEANVVINNTSSAAVTLTTSPLALLIAMELYDRPQFD